MTRARIRANAALADLDRGEEAVVDLTDHVLARAANGLIEIVATDAPHTETHNIPPDSTPSAPYPGAPPLGWDNPPYPDSAWGYTVDDLAGVAAQVVEDRTVDGVMEWVGDHPARAEAALTAERASSSPRSTLIAAVDRVLGDEMQANPEGS